MIQQQMCRLCGNNSTEELKELYDEYDSPCEVYKISANYFHSRVRYLFRRCIIFLKMNIINKFIVFFLAVFGFEKWQSPKEYVLRMLESNL